MITSSNSLYREWDAQPSGQCYFAPCPVPSCPTYEPNSIDGEYSRPFRHIQYKRTPSLRSIATLAMLRCRRIAKCKYRRRQSAADVVVLKGPAGFLALLTGPVWVS
jgi:hypothetical protein